MKFGNLPLYQYSLRKQVSVLDFSHKKDGLMPIEAPCHSHASYITDAYLTKHIFRRIIHFPGQKVTYLQNPKVACTSIETSLWATFEPGNTPKNVHEEKSVRRPYFSKLSELTPEQCAELVHSEFFTVVRNPYARFLSAYLNKVRQNRPWVKLRDKFGFSGAAQPSISEFLERLMDRNPAELDHHFRRQNINLLHGFAPLAVIGHMEHFSKVVAYLAKKDINIKTKDGNATNAADQVRSRLSDKEAKMICDYYRDDFVNFGYSFDISLQTPKEEIIIREPNTEPLTAFLKRATKSSKSA